MNSRDLFVAWGRILSGRLPLLSIEITRECPLSCPGCYAYGESHLGSDLKLQDVVDYRGDDLVNGILAIVRRYKPLHVSLVGGEPMVRHRELSRVLPVLTEMGVWSMVVTSGVIPIPESWCELPRTTVAVSVDGLPEHHDVRRRPATYERILKNIAGRRVNIHLTVTQPMLEREGYLDEYFSYWNARPEVYQIWLSTYTPQIGENTAEIITPESRRRLAGNIIRWHSQYEKLLIHPRLADAIVHPPQSPAECTFARMSVNYTADLNTRVEPCIFGGEPDCGQCGCAISTALHAIQAVELKKITTVGHLVRGSMRVGAIVNRLRPNVGRADRWHSGTKLSQSKLVQIRKTA
jgi:MoaA/NifB/PqqE/SkfB family radical SAM enzyme